MSKIKKKKTKFGADNLTTLNLNSNITDLILRRRTKNHNSNNIPMQISVEV